MRTVVYSLLVASCMAWSARRLEAADYARDVQPILAARCLKCHGPGDPEAGLNLSDIHSTLSPLDSSATAVIPGDPDASELLRRVTSNDEDLRMPPTGERLTHEEVSTLRHWIAAGAEWPAHWAYANLVRPELPTLADIDGPDGVLTQWTKSPIDLFIAAGLQRHGLTPSDSADRRTLLRRLSFDLLGMPPTPDELDAFLSDESPDAYDQLLDRLLASPRYGERWARHWMDIVRFAETHGHDQDRPREHAWPYRDYLIQSLNEDKSYARFVREQIAGDVLFPNEPQAVIATGFLAAGPWDESSLRDIREDSLDREIGRNLDRDDIVTTVMSTFASTSVHCARCHDHKFDPVTHADYYNLQAVFAATDKANRPLDADPHVAARRHELEKLRDGIAELVAASSDDLLRLAPAEQRDAWEKDVLAARDMWHVLDLAEFTSRDGAKLTPLDDGSLLSEGTRPAKDVYTLTVRTGLPEMTALRLEVMCDQRLPKQGPGRQDNGNLHLNELRVLVISDGNDPRRLELKNPRADFNQQGWTIEMALDGNAATAWGIFPEVGKPHQATFELAQPLTLSAHESLRIEMHQVHGGGHLIGRLRWSASQLPLPLATESVPVPPDVLAVLETPRADRSETQQITLAAHVLRQHVERELAALPAQMMVYCGTNQFTADGSFRPSAMPRAVHVLHRGDVTQPLSKAVPAALSCVEGLPRELVLADEASEGERRAALARWLSDSRNGLVWRSIANRLWQYHFGRGLVDTPNDFGQMGRTPTHPELLDWLADTLRTSDGSLKTLHRQIVTSAAYLQTSESRADAAALDGDNRLLWRMNRRRLDAESFRDALLVASGTLDATMGGPSVRQFDLSPGVHVTPNVDYLGFDVTSRANHRRGVYRFLFRTVPDPFMDALDCPDASQLSPQRNESITPLQALATLNDKFVIRQSELLAGVLERASDDVRERITSVYRRLFSRWPSVQELAAVEAYSERHGLANACRFLMNANEFVFVD